LAATISAKHLSTSSSVIIHEDRLKESGSEWTYSERLAYLPVRIQAREEGGGFGGNGKVSPARGFHGCDGFGVWRQRLEWECLIRRHALQQHPERVRQGKTHRGQNGGGFALVRLVNARADNGILGPGCNLLLSYTVAQSIAV